MLTDPEQPAGSHEDHLFLSIGQELPFSLVVLEDAIHCVKILTGPCEQRTYRNIRVPNANKATIVWIILNATTKQSSFTVICNGQAYNVRSEWGIIFVTT